MHIDILTHIWDHV